MICRITNGKASPQNIATAAVIALPIKAGRAGRAKGNKRSNDLTGRKCAEAPGAGSVIVASGALGLVAVELIVMAWPGYVRAPTGTTEFSMCCTLSGLSMPRSSVRLYHSGDGRRQHDTGVGPSW
jgi:hypothetical protein